MATPTQLLDRKMQNWSSQLRRSMPACWSNTQSIKTDTGEAGGLTSDCTGDETPPSNIRKGEGDEAQSPRAQLPASTALPIP